MAVSVLILAGQREGVVDPLCEAAGVERKAIIPINGKPMIDVGKAKGALSCQRI